MFALVAFRGAKQANTRLMTAVGIRKACGKVITGAVTVSDKVMQDQLLAV